MGEISEIQKLSLFLKNVEDLVYILEVEVGPFFTYRMINDSVSSVTGLTDDVIGNRIEDILPPSKSLYLIKKYIEVLTTKKTVVFEYQECENWFGEVALNPVFDDFGSVIYIIAITRNITDKKRLEVKVLESKEIIENSPTILFKWKAETGWPVEYVSENITRFGYTTQELLSGSISYESIIYHEDLRKVTEEVQTCSDNNFDDFSQEYRLVTKNGEIKWVDDRTIIIRDEKGCITHYQGIILDITDKKEIESKLKESNEKYKSLFENHPDAIYSFDLEGNFTSGNTGFESLTGNSIPDILGRSFFSNSRHEDKAQTQLYFNKVIEEKKACKYETTYKHKKGYDLVLSVVNIPIVVEGAVKGVFGIAKDITREHKNEKELKKLTEELQLILNNTHDAIFLWNEEGFITQVNHAFEKIYGWSAEEIYSLGYNPLIPNNKINLLNEIMETLQDHEVVRDVETVRICKDGSKIHVLATYSSIYDKWGNFLTYIGTHTDITTEKMFSQRIQESEERLRNLINASPDTILLRMVMDV